MEGLNFIPQEQRQYPRHIKEPLIRGFWTTMIAAIFIATFSVSVIFFSAVSRGSYKKETKPVLDTTQKKIWISKHLTRCSEDWDVKDITLNKYLDSLSIKVFDKITAKDPNIVEDKSCRACICPSENLLYLQVYEGALKYLSGFNETPAPKESQTLK